MQTHSSCRAWCRITAELKGRVPEQDVFRLEISVNQMMVVTDCPHTQQTGDHSQDTVKFLHFPDSCGIPVYVKCCSYRGMMHVLWCYMQWLYNKCWQVPEWMYTKLKTPSSTATQKQNMVKDKISVLCILNNILGHSFPVNSLSFPWFCWIYRHFPDSYQISWHFQVFQTRGHSENMFHALENQLE